MDTAPEQPAEITDAQARHIFDEVAQRKLGITGTEFLTRWDAGEYTGPPENPRAQEVAMLIPMVRLGDDGTTYTLDVHHEDGSLWANVNELPGVYATGDDLGELGESLAEGIALATDDDTVIVVTEEEFREDARRSLAALGLTYAELEEQARRRDFSSGRAHSLWVQIGGTVGL